MELQSLEALVVFNEFGIDKIESLVNRCKLAGDSCELLGNAVLEIDQGVHEFPEGLVAIHKAIKHYERCRNDSL
ncbi:MAG TPA: hypothetical protein VFW34_08995 [Candidatus Rubrimentiphilum sp.]|nr:hypothetical protein [Candidatus Rubrimentiphilum sp.]